MEQIATFFAGLSSYFTTAQPVTVTYIHVPVAVEYLATIVAALSGAMFSADKKFDIFGATAIALAAGLGGGLIRDILLQSHGIYAFQQPMIIVACLLAGLAGYYFRRLFKHLSSIMFLFDALSVALFAFLGADKALQAGLSFIPVVLLGTMTAVGGGALRDVMAREVPQLFKQGNFYGIAGLVGALVFTTLAFCQVDKTFAAIACIVVTMALRYLSVIFDWHTSEPRDFTPHLSEPVSRFMNQLFIRSGNRDGHTEAMEATERLKSLRRKR